MDIYEQIVDLRRQGRRGAVATIVNVRGSIPSFKTAKMLVRDDGSIVGTIGGGCVEAEVWQAAREVMESKRALAWYAGPSFFLPRGYGTAMHSVIGRRTLSLVASITSRAINRR